METKKKQTVEWIPVSDYLPGLNIPVVGYDKFYGRISEAILTKYSPDRLVFSDSDDCNITHWVLPARPGERLNSNQQHSELIELLELKKLELQALSLRISLPELKQPKEDYNAWRKKPMETEAHEVIDSLLNKLIIATQYHCKYTRIKNEIGDNIWADGQDILNDAILDYHKEINRLKREIKEVKIITVSNLETGSN